MNKKTLALGIILGSIVFFGSCKPKQSAYKSVYEAAKEKETTAPETTVSSQDPTPVSTTSYSYGSATNESVRKEKITPVYESDASGLKAYSVVIAAMGMKPNADALKERIENDGHKVILARNESGMFRVIIASADTKEEAVDMKNRILSGYLEKGSAESLKSKYGIPFNDWWILQRTY